MSTNVPFAASGLTWVLGIEDTCVYPVHPTMLALDEHVLTGHTEHWKDDLLLLKQLGASAVRYGVSWPVVHIAPNQFDWGSLDEIITFATDDLELTIIADLVHYGTPQWLAHSFADPGYPAAIEIFAREFARRYQGRVSHFTPLNEPVTTASFCGLRGVWPPALTGWPGWVAVAVPIAIGMVRTTQALREENPQTVIVHVEASTLIHTVDVDLEPHATLLQEIGWLPTDLMMGRVVPDSEMWAWLLEHGADPRDLDWLRENGVTPDIMGVNYYPNLTPRRLESIDGHPTQISHDRWTDGLRAAILGFAARYGIPIAITETSIEGSDDVRTAWLRDSVAEVRQMIDEGLDIRAYTWWPLFDFVDWSWASGGANIEEFAVERVLADGSTVLGPAAAFGDPAEGKTPFLRRMGVVRLEEQSVGVLVRHPTPAAHTFLKLSSGKTS